MFFNNMSVSAMRCLLISARHQHRSLTFLVSNANRTMSSLQPKLASVSASYRYYHCLSQISIAGAELTAVDQPTWQPRRNAGHSKWQNIRHIKGAKDAERQKISNRITKDIRLAIREGGGTDPKYNSQLRRTIERAEGNDIPKTTITNVLKSIEKDNKDAKPLFVSIMGPLNCSIVLEASTNKTKHLKNAVRTVIKKYGATVADSVSHAFEYKGLIESMKKEESLSEDLLEEIAIEAGAEEVSKYKDSDGCEIYKFLCETSELHNVRKGIEEKGLEVVSARLGYIPTMFVECSAENQELLAPMFEKLDEIEDVIHITDNFEFKS